MSSSLSSSPSSPRKRRKSASRLKLSPRSSGSPEMKAMAWCPCDRRWRRASRNPGALSATTAGEPSPDPDERYREASLLESERVGAPRVRDRKGETKTRPSEFPGPTGN